MSERLQQDASCLVCRCSDKTSSGLMVINRRHNVLSFSASLVKPASDTIQRYASAGALSSDSVMPFKHSPDVFLCFWVPAGTSIKFELTVTFGTYLQLLLPASNRHKRAQVCLCDYLKSEVCGLKCRCCFYRKVLKL